MRVMISPDDGTPKRWALIDLSTDEYRTITRALAKALTHAREVGATADEHDISDLIFAMRNTRQVADSAT